MNQEDADRLAELAEREMYRGALARMPGPRE